MQKRSQGPGQQPTGPFSTRMARLRLPQQIALLCGGLSLLVALVLALIGSLSSRYILEEQQENHRAELRAQVVNAIATTMASGDLIRLEVRLRELLARFQLQQLRVIDLEGRPLGSAGAPGGPDSRKYRAVIRIGDDIAGEAEIVMAPGASLVEQRRMTMGLLFLALLLSLFAAALAANWAQRLAQRLRSATAQLQLVPGGEAEPAGNEGSVEEITQLESAIAALPLELLRAPDTAGADTADYREAGLLYLSLDSLGSYVDTLDEHSLLRHTDLQRQIFQQAAQLYDGSLSVVRQFGLLVSFDGSHSAGSPAFRTVCTAWLIRRVAADLQERSSLRLAVSQACAISETGTGSNRDIYPDLYNQHLIDDMESRVKSAGGEILLDTPLAADPDVVARCRLNPGQDQPTLGGFEEPYCDLLERQRQLLLRELAAAL